MTVLDAIIDASSDPSVNTADLLRKVQVVAHRVKARDVTTWVRNELNGYPSGAELPDYRQLKGNAIGTFSGPMRSFIRHPLTVYPDDLEYLRDMPFREPLTEIQSLSELDEDPGQDWPAYAVHDYERSGVFTMGMHSLFSARTIITRQALRGMLDVVKTRALEVALELQAADPNAGSVGGPTVEAPGVSSAVYNVTQNIYGHGNNVAVGEGITQKSKVAVGDTDALRREVAGLGLSPSDVDEFVAAVTDERSIDGTRTRGFIEKVKTGAIALTGGVASDLAASGLIELASGFLGL